MSSEPATTTKTPIGKNQVIHTCLASALLFCAVSSAGLWGMSSLPKWQQASRNTIFEIVAGLAGISLAIFLSSLYFDVPLLMLHSLGMLIAFSCSAALLYNHAVDEVDTLFNIAIGMTVATGLILALTAYVIYGYGKSKDKSHSATVTFNIDVKRVSSSSSDSSKI